MDDVKITYQKIEEKPVLICVDCGSNRAEHRWFNGSLIKPHCKQCWMDFLYEETD